MLAGSLGGLYLFETATAQFSTSRVGPTKMDGFILHPTEKQFLSRVENQLQLWDLKTGQPLGEPMLHEAKIRDVKFSQNGRTAVSASMDKSARIWDLAQHTSRHIPINQDVNLPTEVAFFPELSRIVTASETARVLDSTNGELLFEFKPKIGMFLDAIFSPDGETVLTGNSAGHASLWDIETGKKIGNNLRHSGWAISVAFSPNGESLVTCGSQDTEASLWGTQTLKPRRRPLLSGGPILAVAFRFRNFRIIS